MLITMKEVGKILFWLVEGDWALALTTLTIRKGFFIGDGLSWNIEEILICRPPGKFSRPENNALILAHFQPGWIITYTS